MCCEFACQHDDFFTPDSKIQASIIRRYRRCKNIGDKTFFAVFEGSKLWTLKEKVLIDSCKRIVKARHACMMDVWSILDWFSNDLELIFGCKLVWKGLSEEITEGNGCHLVIATQKLHPSKKNAALESPKDYRNPPKTYPHWFATFPPNPPLFQS